MIDMRLVRPSTITGTDQQYFSVFGTFRLVTLSLYFYYFCFSFFFLRLRLASSLLSPLLRSLRYGERYLYSLCCFYYTQRALCSCSPPLHSHRTTALYVPNAFCAQSRRVQYKLYIPLSSLSLSVSLRFMRSHDVL